MRCRNGQVASNGQVAHRGDRFLGKCKLCRMVNIAPHDIFIVDSHAWARHALCQFLQDQTDFRVNRIFTDWQALLVERFNPHPDNSSLILLDWESPDIDHIRLDQIRAAASPVKIVAMGVWLSSRRSALAAGADGFINKTDEPEKILTVLRRIGQERSSSASSTLSSTPSSAGRQ